MTATEIITGITIHVVIPLTGLLLFLQLTQQMKKENIQDKPTIELFVIFVTYGGVIIVMLTEICWVWSGMASLGTFYLIFGAPVAMGIITYRHRKTMTLSRYHKWTYISGLAYLIIYVIVLAVFLVTMYFMGDRKV